LEISSDLSNGTNGIDLEGHFTDLKPYKNHVLQKMSHTVLQPNNKL